MANASTGNIHYIDTTANALETDAVKVYYATVTPTASPGYILLLDASSGNTIARLGGTTTGVSMHFDFSSNPLHLPKGIHVTVSNAVATLNVKLVGR